MEEKALGPEHPFTLGNLASVLQDHRKYEAVGAMKRQVLEKSEKALRICRDIVHGSGQLVCVHRVSSRIWTKGH
jgi:hypothetical protein